MKKKQDIPLTKEIICTAINRWKSNLPMGLVSVLLLYDQRSGKQ